MQKQHLKRLRQSVLMLAVTGGLVDSDLNGEDGKQLLDRIQRAKRDGLKHSIGTVSESEAPFKIPENWKWVQLGDITTRIGSGSTPRGGREVYQADGIPLIRSQNVYNDGLRLTKVARISESIHSNMSNTKVHQGDILLNITGASIGRATLVPKDLGEANVNQHVSIIRPVFEDLSEFVHLTLISAYFQKLVIETQTGMARGGLAAKRLKKLPMPLPPLHEQAVIVRKVAEAFRLIDDIERDIEKSEDRISMLEKSVFTIAAQGRIVPQITSEGTGEDLLNAINDKYAELVASGKMHQQKKVEPVHVDEAPFTIPASWRWARLGDICEYGGAQKARAADLQDGTWILELEDIERDSSRIITKVRIPTRQPNSDKIVFDKGDILYSKLRPYLNKVLIADENGVASGELTSIRPYGDLVSNAYLLNVLKSGYFLNYVNSIAYGMKMPRLGTKDGRKALIPLPPFEEQIRISDKVSKVVEVIENQRQLLYGVISPPLLTQPVIANVAKPNYFNIQQAIGAILQTGLKRGEMVIAKVLYLSQEVYKAPLSIPFSPQNFGPYDARVKKALTAGASKNNKFFRTIAGDKGSFYDLGQNSHKLFKYNNETMQAMSSALDSLAPLLKLADGSFVDSSSIERLATVCKIIQDNQTIDEPTIKIKMHEWKADKFTDQEIKKSLSFITAHGWDKKLLDL